MITEVSPFGIVKIVFNSKMKTENINKTLINSTLIDVYIQPSDDWHLYDESYIVNQTLNCTWEVSEYENSTMILNLTLLNPLHVSPNIRQDKLFVHFREIGIYFISSEHLVDLHTFSVIQFKTN